MFDGVLPLSQLLSLWKRQARPMMMMMMMMMNSYAGLGAAHAEIQLVTSLG
jgi:hypothetical protein